MEKVSNWKTRRFTSKKPKLTKQTLNTDFINCIWPYFTRLAAANFLLNLLMYVWFFRVPRRFYHAVNLFNYLNSFVNPILYALRIAEFRRALALCCKGRHVQAAVNTKLSKRKKERHGTTAEFSRELAFEQDVMDTKL